MYIQQFEDMLSQYQALRDSGVVRRENMFSDAQWYILNAYKHSKAVDSDILIFKEVCWPQYVDEVCAMLKEAGINEFCLARSSQNLMERLVEFQGNGWYVSQMVSVPLHSRPPCLFGPAIKLVYIKGGIR